MAGQGVTMAKKEVKNGKRFWIDAEGNPIPESYVSKGDKKRDRLVEKLFKQAEKMNLKLKQMKENHLHEIERFLGEVAAEYGTDWKGNAELRNFSQDKEISVQINKKIAFNEKLQIARVKINQCIEKWSEDTDMKIRVLINRAFKVDAKGNLDSKLILSLRSIKIKDKLWMEAMELISESIQIEYSKKYLHFRFKDANGKWQTISLNFSHL